MAEVPFLSGATIDGKAPFIQVCTIPGTLLVQTGVRAFVPNRSIVITNISVTLGVAPTGASAIFDVNKNGTTIFSTQGNRPTVTASNTQDLTSTPDVTTAAAGDKITVDVDQIGSTIPGGEATVQIEYY